MRLHALRAGLAVLLLAAVACGARKPAEEPAPPETDASAEPPAEPAPPAPAPAPSLYERLGKKEALAGVVEELLGNVLADNRIARLFDRTRKDKARTRQLGARLTAELCVVSGGGDDCGYDGKPMKEAHAKMNVTGAQWDAFIEDLGIALKTRGVDDATATELIDRLSQQTKADIVVTPNAK